MGIQTVEAILPLVLMAASATSITVTVEVYDGTSGP